MKSVNSSKPGYTSITFLKIEHIAYNLIFTTQFNDSSISITIPSWDYLNLLLANEYVGDVTISTQVIRYNQRCSMRIRKSDCSIHIKFNYCNIQCIIVCLYGTVRNEYLCGVKHFRIFITYWYIILETVSL